MELNPVFFLEFGVFGGAAIGWGVWQLWWLRRDRLKREAEARLADGLENAARHPEGQ